MDDILGILVVVFLVVSFFYFGYRHDYRRNPKEFKRTIIGVPLSFLSILNGIPFLSEWIKKWIKKES